MATLVLLDCYVTVRVSAIDLPVKPFRQSFQNVGTSRSVECAAVPSVSLDKHAVFRIQKADKNKNLPIPQKHNLRKTLLLNQNSPK